MDWNSEQLPFWFDDGAEVAGASEEALARAEARLDRTLPASLRSLLSQRDGGVSNYEAYHVGEIYVPLPAFFNVASLISAFDAAGHFGTPDGVIAIASGAHHWLGLDYRIGSEPSVVYQQSEDAEIEAVAPSFDEFLAGLVEEG